MEVRRLDLILVEQFSISREYAKEVISQGRVSVNGKIISKAGAKIPLNAAIQADINPPEFVSRAGFKLKFALEHFNIELTGLVCLDIGASTGGFTHCMLKNGAKKIIALDNGNGQLHPLLKEDERVISIENTDIRNISLSELPFIPQFITCDVSFISVTKIAYKIDELLPFGNAIILIKPQFEVGRENLNKSGIAFSKKTHNIIIDKIKETFKSYNLNAVNLIESPIKGKNGNVEYLLLLKR